VKGPPNEEMQLTKPDGLLVGGRGDHVRCRRAIVFESGFAADLRCSASAGARAWKRRGTGRVVGGWLRPSSPHDGRQLRRLHPRERVCGPRLTAPGRPIPSSRSLPAHGRHVGRAWLPCGCAGSGNAQGCRVHPSASGSSCAASMVRHPRQVRDARVTACGIWSVTRAAGQCRTSPRARASRSFAL
jgi:hypothetical protein